MREVSPILLDDNGILMNADGEPVEVEIHVAWHNFEIGRSALRTFRDILRTSHSIELVQTAAAGLDSPFFKELLDRQITLCNSDAQALSIAEYAIAGILNAYHDFPARRRMQAEQSWQRYPFRELSGSNCLIVGYGNIGKRIAKRLLAFEVNVSVIRRSSEELGGISQTGTLADLPVLLPEADIVVLACALNESTSQLMNRRTLGICKQGCVLVNVARGDLVDEHALLECLDAGKIQHAVLDVFAEEPLPESHPFWSSDRITLSAHTSNAGSGREARGDELFLSNLRALLAKGPLLNHVNSQP